MVADNDFIIPVWPDPLQHVDVAKLSIVLDFVSPCQVQPADFLELGRALRLAGRQFADDADIFALRKSKALFQPALSEDPVAQRKFQKPSPAFVVTLPIEEKTFFDVGDHLGLEVLFIGTGITLIREFMRSLIHLGHLGLIVGEGCFEVTEVLSQASDGSYNLAWRQNQPISALTSSVHPLSWLFQDQQIVTPLTVKFMTPTRLLANSKPLRNPLFEQVFPFLLRRVTSMLYAHAGVEVFDDPTDLLARARQLCCVSTELRWCDWRPLPGRQGLVVGGFVGKMVLEGQELEEIYWVLAAASLFGIGKGATYGAGRFILS